MPVIFAYGKITPFKKAAQRSSYFCAIKRKTRKNNLHKGAVKRAEKRRGYFQKRGETMSKKVQ